MAAPSKHAILRWCLSIPLTDSLLMFQRDVLRQGRYPTSAKCWHRALCAVKHVNTTREADEESQALMSSENATSHLGWVPTVTPLSNIPPSHRHAQDDLLSICACAFADRRPFRHKLTFAKTNGGAGGTGYRARRTRLLDAARRMFMCIRRMLSENASSHHDEAPNSHHSPTFRRAPRQTKMSELCEWGLRLRRRHCGRRGVEGKTCVATPSHATCRAACTPSLHL